MTTGSWCLTEILMSRKPCSSNSEHSHSADSTRASGVALPYLASSRLSSEPALTPIRIGIPASEAALAFSAPLSSNCLMLPGLTRTAAQPASIAANTYLGWKWMSAMTGIWDLRAMSGSASASSWDGTATRTIWQPDAVSSAICCRVAFTSAVSVVVIDCTVTGGPPPTGPDAACGIPRSILMSPIRSIGHPRIPRPAPLNHPGGNGRLPTLTGASRSAADDADRVHDVGRDQGEAGKEHDHEQAQA